MIGVTVRAVYSARRNSFTAPAGAQKIVTKLINYIFIFIYLKMYTPHKYY